MRESASAFAPATVANVAVGFDLLGFAIEGAGDTVTVTRISEPRVEIAEITGAVTKLPSDPARNTATAGLVRMIGDLGLGHGFRVSIRKGIPLGSGMGGSAASAVGAAVAAGALLDKPLGRSELLGYALVGEAVASGAVHADNVAPCLYGGMTLVLSTEPLDVVELPVPADVRCVLVHPHLEVSTKHARQILKPQILMSEHVRQSAYLAGFLTACYTGDLALLSRSMIDTLIEPQREGLIPGFAKAKMAAQRSGALGFSISGSGPSVFAWARSLESARAIERGIVEAFESEGLLADSWVSPVSRSGARLL